MNNNTKFAISALLIILAASTRFLPHSIPNVSPIAGMALFGAAYFNRSALGLIIPLLALFLSDLVLNNTVLREYYPQIGFIWITSIWVMLGFVAVWAVGRFGLKKVSVPTVLISSITGSLVFFLVSNLSTFLETTLYSKDFSGLMTCYAAGLPFLKYTFIGDLAFTSVIFGLFAIVTSDNSVVNKIEL